MNDIDAMRQAVETARKTASSLKIKATKARIAAQNDKKSEAKAVASTKVKDASTAANAEVRRLERELGKAETRAAKQAEKDAKKAEQQAAEEAKAKAKAAAEALAAASLIEDAPVDQEGRDDIDWVRLADEFVAIARPKIAIVDGAWGAFDGSRWNFSGARGSALARKEVVEFFRFRPGEEGVALRKLANGPETLLRFSQLELTRDASEFNNRTRTAHLFNVANGTLNLRTLKLQKPKSSDMLTFKSEIRLNGKADAKRIREAFVKNLAGDYQQLECLQRGFGYAMTGERKEKKIFFLLGNEKKRGENGDNGKTMVMEAFRRVVGSSCGSIKTSLIVETGNRRGANEHDGAMVPLAKLRVAVGAEFGRNDVFDEDVLKRLTGGDTIQARGVGAADSIEFINFAKIFFTTNYLPLIPSRDQAMTGRILPFPFFVRFRSSASEPGDGPIADPAFADWLESDEGKEAMLLWMAKGAQAWYQQGINAPASLIALRDEKLARHDTWAPFVRDYLVGDEDGEISVAALKVLAEEFRGSPFRTQSEENAFLRDLEGRGAEIEHRGGKAYRRGFSLSKIAEHALTMRSFKLPGRVIRREIFEIVEPGRPVPVRLVPKGDLMGAWLEYFEGHEEELVVGGEHMSVPGWGKMRRVS